MQFVGADRREEVIVYFEHQLRPGLPRLPVVAVNAIIVSVPGRGGLRTYVIKLQITSNAPTHTAHRTYRENSIVNCPREIDSGQRGAGYAGRLHLVRVVDVAAVILATVRPVNVHHGLRVGQHNNLHVKRVGERVKVWSVRRDFTLIIAGLIQRQRPDGDIVGV